MIHVFDLDLRSGWRSHLYLLPLIVLVLAAAGFGLGIGP